MEISDCHSFDAWKKTNIFPIEKHSPTTNFLVEILIEEIKHSDNQTSDAATKFKKFISILVFICSLSKWDLGGGFELVVAEDYEFGYREKSMEIALLGSLGLSRFRYRELIKKRLTTR